LGHEVTPEEFHARTGVLAGMRRDHVDDGLIAALVPLRYLDLTNTIQRAWEDPEAWVSGIVARYQVAFIRSARRGAHLLLTNGRTPGHCSAGRDPSGDCSGTRRAKTA